MKTVFSSILFSLLVSASAIADPLVAKISKEEVAGKIFERDQMIALREKSERGPYKTEDVETFLSSDKHFDTGMYRSGPSRFVIDDAYGVDEFMYFLEGSVTLTSSDGTVTEVRAGEAVTIAKEWTGIWDSEGYTKIYVIYSADKPLSD